jgi:hypothetical protein
MSFSGWKKHIEDGDLVIFYIVGGTVTGGVYNLANIYVLEPGQFKPCMDKGWQRINNSVWTFQT